MNFNPEFFKSLITDAIKIAEAIEHTIEPEYKRISNFNPAFFDEDYAMKQERLKKLDLILN